jgi:hypothetical protein
MWRCAAYQHPASRLISLLAMLLRCISDHVLLCPCHAVVGLLGSLMRVSDTHSFLHTSSPCAAQVCRLLLNQPTHPALANDNNSGALISAAGGGHVEVCSVPAPCIPPHLTPALIIALCCAGVPPAAEPPLAPRPGQ